jgi:hypothetical protein
MIPIVLVILVGVVLPIFFVCFLRYCFPTVNIGWWIALMFGTGWALIAMVYIGSHCFP